MRCVRKRRGTCLSRNYTSRDGKQSYSMKEHTRGKLLRSLASKEKFVPVLVETHKQDKLLFSSQRKFTVPFHMPASQFSDVIRSEMQLPSYQSYSLLLNGTRLSSTMPIGKVHNEYKNENGLLNITIISENTFGCRAPLVRPVTPEFDSLNDVLFVDDLPENLPPDVDVIHLTAIVSNPNMVSELSNDQPVPSANSPLPESIPNYQEHLQGIVSTIADAIMEAISSPPMQSVILQSSPNSEITLNPQLVKDALLSYMDSHALTFAPPFDVDNFYTTIKISPPPEE